MEVIRRGPTFGRGLLQLGGWHLGADHCEPLAAHAGGAAEARREPRRILREPVGGRLGLGLVEGWWPGTVSGPKL